MAFFYLSPTVNIITTDDPSLYVPAVATSIGATVGNFEWGPIGQAIAISTEQNLFENFGKPNDQNFKDWMCTNNFLAYSNALRVVRTANITGNGVTTVAWQDGTAKPAGYVVGDIVVPTNTTTNPYRFKVQSTTGITPHTTDAVLQPTWPTGLGDTVVDNDITWVNIGPANGRPTNAGDVDNNADAEAFKVIKNATDWEELAGTRGTGSVATYLAKYPGKYGNRVSIAVRDGKAHTPPVWTLSTTLTLGAERVPVSTGIPHRFEVVAITTGITHTTEPTWPTTLGATVVDAGVTWKNVGVRANSWEAWEYAKQFPFQPEQDAGVRDEIAVVVFLDGVIVERWIGDVITGRFDASGVPNYIGSIVNRQSRYIWLNDERAFNGFVTGTTSFYSLNFGKKVNLVSGLDGDAPTDDDYIEHWRECFSDGETTDINLPFVAGASGIVGKYVIQNVAELRKDCIAFVSPMQSDVVGVTSANALINILDRRVGLAGDFNISSSYGFLDGNYKYQYDPYSDKFRWVPLNGDIAGLAAASDFITGPWYSFAGYNRGNIKNVIKLAWNPTKIQRDDLYSQCINPVITTRGEGSLLFGDRTMLKRPTAFREVGIRRTFIVLAKAIATAAKYNLFEFNDEITRNRFIQLVTPFLRDVQSRRGIQEDNPGRPGFLVVADQRINTPEVIDRQEFRAKILVRPNHSINFIEVEIIATKTGAVFEELIPELKQTING